MEIPRYKTEIQSMIYHTGNDKIIKFSRSYAYKQ